MRGNAEIVLIAYSYPGLPDHFSKNNRRNWMETYLKVPSIYAEYLNVLTVVSNKAGHFSSSLPIGAADFDIRFTGGSSIVDEDGNLIERLAEN